MILSYTILAQPVNLYSPLGSFRTIEHTCCSNNCTEKKLANADRGTGLMVVNVDLDIGHQTFIWHVSRKVIHYEAIRNGNRSKPRFPIHFQLIPRMKNTGSYFDRKTIYRQQIGHRSSDPNTKQHLMCITKHNIMKSINGCKFLGIYPTHAEEKNATRSVMKKDNGGKSGKNHLEFCIGS